MEIYPSKTMKQKSRVATLLVLVLLVMGLLLSYEARGDPQPVNLGSAGSFGVLAGAGITVTGPTTITGDIGTFPTSSITGFGNVTLTGTDHAGDVVTQNAQNDLSTAYNDALGRTATITYAPVTDLGGLTLAPGVYNDPSSIAITGTLTLDALGDPNAVWISSLEPPWARLQTAV
jgi:hypothetical protein